MLEEANTGRSWPFQHQPNDCARYRSQGHWRDQTIADQLSQLVMDQPDATCVADMSTRLTYGEIDTHARRLAGYLRALGLKRGEVVSFQLPNWNEVLVIDLAATILGLVANPIVPIYREREVEYMLADSEARVMFVPENFRDFNYVQMVEGMVSRLPGLEAIVRVRASSGTGPTFEDIINEGELVTGGSVAQPDDPKLLMYTSGTTGRPKGVVHSHNTLDAELGNVVRYWSLDYQDVCFMPSPVTHITGYLYGVMFPFAYGIRSVLMERWDAHDAVGMFFTHGGTFTVGATPFLQELISTLQQKQITLDQLRVFACGGAPVPPELIRRAHCIFPNAVVCRVYGSTEAPTVSLGVSSRDQEELAATTEGQVVGHDVRIVSECEKSVSHGTEGEIRTRGPELMLGYLYPEDNQNAYDACGFFCTGDLGVRTEDGYLTISGRKKDLIIRGGENLSAKEIEDAIFEYPGVEEVAVVAMPHDRLGETVCAFVRVQSGMAIDVKGLSTFLSDYGLARQKHPERVQVVDTMPKTASGKIQKYVLRKQASHTVESGAGG